MASGGLVLSRYITSDPNTNFIGQWSSTPNAGNNTSSVRIQIYATKQTGDPIIARDVTTYVAATPTNYDSAIAKSETVQLTLIPGSQQQQTIFDQTWTNISHDADGNCSVSLSISVSGVVQGTGAQTITLDHIDRPTSVIASLVSKTETSATINWSTLAAIDYLWYSTNGGSTWTANGSVSGTSGAITITGLSHNTTYSIKLKVRRASNQQTSESDTLSVTTYSYPYATSMPDFNIGSALRVGLYNPLGRSVSVKLQDSGGNQLASQSTSGTTVTGFNGSTAVTAIYGSIPNAKSGTYKIAITYGGHTETRTGGKYYTVEADCKPSLNTPTYADVSLYPNITGDDQVIVQNNSTPKVTVTGLASQKSASIASVTAFIPGQTITLTVSGTSAEGTFSAPNSAVNMTCTVTITDSRGYKASKTATMTVEPYFEPKVTLTVRRHNNYYSATDITADVEWCQIGTNQLSLNYLGQSTNGDVVSGTLTNGVTITETMDNEQDWTLVVLATDRFGAMVYTPAFISEGTPLIFFDRDKYSVGINGFPKFDKTFEVDGAVLNRNVMTAQATGVQGASGTNKISLTSQNSVGDQLTLNTGSIKVGAKISKVLASLQLVTLGATAGSHTIYIYKNSSAALSCTLTLPNSVSTETMIIPPRLIDVIENDTLSVYIDGFTTSNYISAYFTVEAMA